MGTWPELTEEQQARLVENRKFAQRKHADKRRRQAERQAKGMKPKESTNAV